MKDLNIDEIKTDFLENVKSKLKNTFLSTFIFAFLIHNWQLLFILFNFEKEYRLSHKIFILEKYIKEEITLKSLVAIAVCSIGFIVFIMFFNLISKALFDFYNETILPKITNFFENNKVPTKLEFDNLKNENTELKKEKLKLDSDNYQLNNEKLGIKKEYDSLNENFQKIKVDYELKINEYTEVSNKNIEYLDKINILEKDKIESSLLHTNIKSANIALIHQKKILPNNLKNITKKIYDYSKTHPNYNEEDFLNTFKRILIIEIIFEGDHQKYKKFLTPNISKIIDDLTDKELKTLIDLFNNNYLKESIINYELSINFTILFNLGYIKKTDIGNIYLSQEGLKFVEIALYIKS